MHHYEAIQLIALRDVLKETPDYMLRKTLRWYSVKFHTPLDAVRKLPVEDVLQAFHECAYEDMEVHEREEERLRLLESPEERRAREAQGGDATDDADRFAAEVAEKEAAKPKGKADPDTAVARIAPEKPIQKLPEPSFERLAESIKAMEEITMTFVSEDELESHIAKLDSKGEP